MSFDNMYKLNSNPLLLKYLRENSNWYKDLNRGRDIKEMESEMKIRYKKRPEDRIIKIRDSLEMVSTFLNILR